jgi:hypothetical protein
MNTFKEGSFVRVRNPHQWDYEYRLEHPPGTIRRGFNPALTPTEMLQLGVFGGSYMHGCLHDYPAEFSAGVTTVPKSNPRFNCFKVQSGDSREYWESRGWMSVEDPLGWFEWYCRYWMGRELPGEDSRQIARWAAFAPRHRGAIIAFASGDITGRSKTRQALLHWAHDPLPDFENMPGESCYQKILRVVHGAK